jgi:hypothetical protein
MIGISSALEYHARAAPTIAEADGLLYAFG